MQSQTRNVALLAACQALLLTNNVTLIALNGLMGFALAENKALATLPITTYVVGSSLTTFFAALLMQRIGRRAGFSLGSVLGMAGTALCALAVFDRSFWLLCAGTFVVGMYNAFGQQYRFAAADAASTDFRSRAISLVLAGGIVGGVLGPETSKLTRDLLDAPFAASYLALVGFAALSLLIQQKLDIPPLAAEDRHGGGRPLSAIMRQPAFVVAVLGAAVGYGVMNFLMTATPLAMDRCNHPYSDAAFVIEWHVIGMFAPSFFTGSWIRRFGVLRIMSAGCLLMFACVAIALAGVELMHFWWALLLLGIGWNFLYIGGTTLLTETYTPAERARTQGINEVLIFAAMGISSLSSGIILTAEGWQTLNYASLPFLALTATAIFWLGWKRRVT